MKKSEEDDHEECGGRELWEGFGHVLGIGGEKSKLLVKVLNLDLIKILNALIIFMRNVTCNGFG